MASMGAVWLWGEYTGVRRGTMRRESTHTQTRTPTADSTPQRTPSFNGPHPSTDPIPQRTFGWSSVTSSAARSRSSAPRSLANAASVAFPAASADTFAWSMASASSVYAVVAGVVVGVVVGVMVGRGERNGVSERSAVGAME